MFGMAADPRMQREKLQSNMQLELAGGILPLFSFMREKTTKTSYFGWFWETMNLPKQTTGNGEDNPLKLILGSGGLTHK